MSLYKLVTTENVDLNYKAFEKYELIDCISNLRTTYFRLKKENEEVVQLKEDINKYKRLGYKHLQEKNNNLEERIDKAIDYLETKRIREKAIIDIDVLEGILKEVK